MPPPTISRYQGTLQGMAQFGNPSQQQQQHLQHHAQTVGAPGLTPQSIANHQHFGNPNSNLNLFNPPGGTNAGNYGAGFGGAGAGGTGLGSHAAQMGFAHGAALQRQEANEGAGSGELEWKGMGKTRIRDVWRGNLAHEMIELRNVVERYPYISMDTEFPGIVARPMGNFTTKADYHYQTLRCNVDMLKIIQLGITLFSEGGDLPHPQPPESSGANGSTYANNLVPYPCTWQFNFRFSLENDMYAQASIELLQKAGLDFQMHEKNGIEPADFGSFLLTSGLVLTEDVRWISFHSGYDFGYLIKMMQCRPLPEEEREFRKLLKIYFPGIYDIKYLMKDASRNHSVNNSPLSPQAAQIVANLGQQSGLQDLADELGVKRVGPQHQAGSDSLVTGKIFWEVRRVVFGGHIDDEKYLGQVWGLNGIGLPAPGAATAAAAAAAAQQQAQGNGSSIYPGSGNPGTPNTDHVGLAGTPQPHGQARMNSMGPLTPAAGGGIHGGFQFGKG